MENKNFKFENGILTVPTLKGNIVIKVMEDDEYQGVEVNFESNDIKDSYALYEKNKKPCIPIGTISYNTESKELSAYMSENRNSDDYDRVISYTNSLVFNEDFEILENGTKILCGDETAFIMDNDADNCPDGYEDSLNYYIKYSLENETYEELLERIKEDDNWYDTMILWRDAKVIQD